MPDFGSFRGFGEKLAQGQTPTQLGKIGSESAYDGDANSFFVRVSSAGGSLSNTEKVAVNQLVLDMKSTGIWNSMKAVYPMVGASAAACAQNLKSSSFTGTFSGGWTYSANGITGNGSNTSLNTGIIPANNLLLNSTHISIYSRTDVNQITADLDAGDTNRLRLLLRFDNAIYYAMHNNGGYTGNITNANSTGFYIGSRTATSQKLFKNNTAILSSGAGTGTLSSLNVYIGALNNNPSPTLSSSRNYAFASLGDGLTDTQAGNLYTAVQAFQTSLSRQV
jgi:hypothetical protein